MSEEEVNKLKSHIRVVPDFPKKGIQFQDISTLCADPWCMKKCIEIMAAKYKGEKIDYVAGFEARGFIFGPALAIELGCGKIVTKHLNSFFHRPYKTEYAEYTKEYGKDKIEVNVDAWEKGANVLLIDDLLATGGTAGAGVDLVEKLGAKCVGLCVVVHLTGLPEELDGTKNLAKKNCPVFSIFSAAEKVSLSGFKSFSSSRPQILDFGPGFNCIQGENGSEVPLQSLKFFRFKNLVIHNLGNIFDSICFALSQDLNQVRSSTLNDLFCQTSKTPTNSIEITLIFKRNSNNLIFDKYLQNDICKLTVKVSKENLTRNYFLNNKKITSQKYLRDFLHNIGLSMFNKQPTFIIHQNSVTNSKSSIDLANMITDCSGSKKVQELINKTTKELQKWRNIEISIQKSIDSFEKCLNDDLELYEKSSRYNDSVRQIEILEKKKKIIENNEKLNLIQDLHHERNKLNLEIEAFQKDLESIDTSLIDLNLKNKKYMVTEEKKKLISLEDDFSQLKIKISGINNRINILEKELLNFGDPNDTLHTNKNMEEISLINETIERLKTEIKLKRYQILENENLIKKNIGNNEGSGDKLNNIIKELKNHESQLINISGIIESLKEENLSMDTFITLKEQEYSKIENEEIGIMRTLESFKVSTLDISTLEHEMKIISSKLEIEKQKKFDLESKIERLKVELSIYLQEIDVNGFLGTVYSLFDLKQNSFDYLNALNVISSGIHPIVMENSKNIKKLFEYSEKSKTQIEIWCIDRMNCSKYSQHFMKMKKMNLTIPLDFLVFDEMFRDVISKSFGGYVLTNSDSESKELMEKYNISSVTKNGTKFIPGSINGGYRKKENNSVFHKKFELEKLLKIKESFENEIKNLETQMNHFNQKYKEFKINEDLIIQKEKIIFKKSHLIEELSKMKTNFKENELKIDENELMKKYQNDKIEELKQLQNVYQSNSNIQVHIQKFIKNKKFINEQLSIQCEEIQKTLFEFEFKEENAKRKFEEMNRRKMESKEDEEMIKNEIKLLKKELKELYFFESIEKEIENKKQNIIDLKNSISILDQNLNKQINQKNSIKEEIKNKNEIIQQIELKLKKNRIINQQKIDNTIDLSKEEINFQISKFHKIKEELSKDSKIFNQNFDKIEKKKKEIFDFKQKLQFISIGISKFKESIESSKNIADQVNEETFEKVNSKFKIYFSSMVPNKIACIKKISLKIEEGIDFEIQNSNNQKKTICPYNELSGGQKTLLNMSFVFAISQVNKSLFYIIDEVDAALDENNQEIIAKSIKSIFKDCQILSISHNSNFQLEAEKTITISKKDGVSIVNK
eukprot:gene8839-787_t